MGKYAKYESVRREKKPQGPHPLWRGIGCLMMVLIPVMSYAGASLLVDANLRHHWLPLPRALYGPAVKPLLYAELAVGAILSMLGFVLLVVFYSFLNSILGPPRYGPMDAPPPRRKR